MYIIITIITIIIAIFIMLFVLAQNPKGGGANAMMGGLTNQVMGARRSGDFLEKGTWYLGIGLIALCLLSALAINKNDAPLNEKEKETKELIDQGGAAAPAPDLNTQQEAPANATPEEGTPANTEAAPAPAGSDATTK